MKRAIVAIALLAVMVACGGGSSSSTKPTGSGIKNRAFVTNAFSGAIQIIDASKDTLSTSTITLSLQPETMAVSPGREVTLALDGGTNQVSVITNSSEVVAGTIQLPGPVSGLTAKDNNTGFAVVRNASVTGATDLGAVTQLDLINGTAPACTATPATLCVSVPHASHIALSHSGGKLLVFSDNSNSISIIDTANFTSTPVTLSGFDHPVSGVFSTDDNTAYVVNCGPECGGTQAGVAVVNMSTPALTSTIAFPSSGATVALLNGSTLYVAGTTGGRAYSGTLTVLNVGGAAPTISAGPVTIGDGTHTQMALASNGKLFIGSNPCSNAPSGSQPGGCLTVFDTSSNAAVIDAPKGFVTGMVPIAGRNVTYVAEGGELRIYDTTTSAESTTKSINITGQAFDVKAVDQPQ